jgi:hypothetical protein
VILAAEPPDLILTTQSDHAHFAAELLGLWRADGLPRHPRRADLLFAVREHDNGWREADAAPEVDPASGRPRDFLTHPFAARREIWERGVRRYAQERPYAAALIAEHGLQVHRDRGPEADWREFLEELEGQKNELLEAAGASEAELAADYPFLQLADTASLAACAAWAAPFTAAGVRGSVAGAELRLDPFPLAGPTTFQVACRRISDRPYAGALDLTGTLASARWERRPLRVTPG